MLDPKLIRNDIDNVALALTKRGFELNVNEVRALEEQRKAIQIKTEELQAERNQRSKNIGKAKAAGEDIEPMKQAVNDLGEELEKAKTQLHELQENLNHILKINISNTIRLIDPIPPLMKRRLSALVKE